MDRVPKVAALIAISLVLGAGAYAFASSSAATISVCVSHHGGTLYRASACHSGDTRLSWNQRGPRGLRGPRGPQGPGATSFADTVNQNGTPLTLTLGNGLTLTGSCSANHVELALSAALGSDAIEVSGTAYDGSGQVQEFDSNLPGEKLVSSNTSVDLDVIVRDSTANTNFVRIDAHGAFSSPCSLWGMITPSG